MPVLQLLSAREAPDMGQNPVVSTVLSEVPQVDKAALDSQITQRKAREDEERRREQ